MLYCEHIEKCYYLNNTIMNNIEFRKVFMDNFCNGFYKKCALWYVLSNLHKRDHYETILPFEYRKMKRILEKY